MIAVRWLCLVYGIVALACATILYRPFRARIVVPALRRAGAPASSLLNLEWPGRVLGIVAGFVALGTWWYLRLPVHVAALRAAAAAPAASPAGESAQRGVRALLARGSLLVTFVAFGGYLVYGLYLEARLIRLRRSREIPKGEARYDPAIYAPGAEPWIRRARRHDRWETAVWLGSFVAGSAVYLLLKP